MDLFDGESVLAALAGLTELPQPVTLMTAPRGLFDQTPGLYSPSEIERWRAVLPTVAIREVPDVNHYTIVMGAAGAGAVAREVRARGSQPRAAEPMTGPPMVAADPGVGDHDAGIIT